MSGFQKIAGESRQKKKFEAAKTAVDPVTGAPKLRKGYDNGNRITVQALLTEASIQTAVRGSVEGDLTVEQVENISRVLGGCISHMGNTGNHCLEYLNVLRNLLNQPVAFLQLVVGEASAAAVKAGLTKLTAILTSEMQAEVAAKMKVLRASKPAKPAKLVAEHAMVAGHLTGTAVPVTQYGFSMALVPTSAEQEFGTLKIEATGPGNKVAFDSAKLKIVKAAAEAPPVKINKNVPTFFVPKEFTDVAFSRLLSLAALAVASYNTVHEGENVETSRTFALNGVNYTYKMSGIRNMFSLAYAAVERFYQAESYASNDKFSCGAITFGTVKQGTVNFRPYINNLSSYAMVLRHPNLNKVSGISSAPDSLAKVILDSFKYLLYEPQESNRSAFVDVLRATARFSFEYKPKAPSAPLLTRKRQAIKSPEVDPMSLSGDESKPKPAPGTLVFEVAKARLEFSSDKKRLIKVNDHTANADTSSNVEMFQAVAAGAAGDGWKQARGPIRTFLGLEGNGNWLPSRNGPNWASAIEVKNQ